MREIKLLKLLKSLSKAEFSRLSKYLRSPFFNHTASFPAYYDYLKRHYPDFEIDKIKPEKIWQKVYPGQPFHEVKFWRLSSDFHKLVKQYITILQLEKQPQTSQQLYIKAMSDRGNYEIFEKETQQQLADLAAQPYRDWEYFSTTYNLNFDYFFHPLTPKHTLQDEALEELMNSIDKQFVLAKYRIGSEMKNRERTLAKQYQIRFLEDIQREAADGFFSGNAQFKMFSHLFEMYQPEQAALAFEQLKNLLTKEIRTLRRVDKSLFLTQLINYTVRQINSGNAAFYKESLDLYKIGLENGLVIENERIHEAAFGNIALLGCHAGEFDWTKSFIEDYQAYLEESIREDAVALNTGLWYFHQDRFEEAYDWFFNHSFSPFYQPKARLHLIVTLFEQFLLNETLFDLLNSQIEAYEKFLQRSKMITIYFKESNLNSIFLIKRLAFGIFQRKDLSKLKESLLKSIHKNNIIIVREWLLKKIGQLS